MRGVLLLPLSTDACLEEAPEAGRLGWGDADSEAYGLGSLVLFALPCLTGAA